MWTEVGNMGARLRIRGEAQITVSRACARRGLRAIIVRGGNMIPKLRDYQDECLKAIYERYKAGVRRQLVCLPTGTGKTVIFASFPRFFRMKKRMLVVAHREELLDQARDKILRANPELSVEIEQASRVAGESTDVVVASVPTLGRKNSKRLARLDPEQFYLIVVDEAHHSTAETYRRVLEHFKVFDEGSPRLLVGFTATPKRGDGQGLDAVYEEIAFSRNLPEMIMAKHLSPVAGYRVETDVDLSRVRTRMGDFVTRQLSDAVNVKARNDLVVKVFRDHLADRQTLCFCVDVAHAKSLAKAFRKGGIATAAVTGEMEKDRRARALADFSSGKVRVLTNCMVLTEGYDESSVAGIILARPTKSTLLYTQMIGRGTRLHPGKENAVMIDIVDVAREHTLVTLPALFGLTDRFDLQGSTTTEVEEALGWVRENRPWVRPELATSLSDLRYRCTKINLMDLKLPDELLGVATFAWTGTGEGTYRLGLGKGKTVVIASTIIGEWEVSLVTKGKEKKLGATVGMPEAVGRAERWITANRADSLGLVLLRAKWRGRPASAKQVEYLKSRKISVPRGITKGQASHLIAMLPRRRARASG